MSSNPYGKRNIFINISWKLFERGSSLIITFLVQIFLARLLEPAAFGLAAIVTVFVQIGTIFISGGLSSALIQKKNADELDFSSIFWMNLLISGFLYLTLFTFSPFIASFFGYVELAPMLRVLGLKLIISAVNSIQTAYISKNMMFRFYFFSTLTGKIASGAIGIIIALIGGGAWALVGQALSMVFFETVVLWFKVKWRPSFLFSFERAKKLYAFAWKVMLMTFIEAIRDQLRNLIIGKRYSSEELAFYDKGFLFPANIITNISSSLTAVMFPVLSNSQDNKTKALAFCRSWLSIFAYTILPVLIGLVMTSEKLVAIILTEKWIPSIPYLQFASISYMAWIIEVPIRETLKSLGYATAILVLQIIKTAVALLVWFLILDFGVMAIAFSGVILGAFNAGISIFVASRLFGYRFIDLWNDLINTIGLNILMAVAVYAVSLVGFSNWVELIVQVLTGGLVYILSSIVAKNKNYLYFSDLIFSVIKR